MKALINVLAMLTTAAAAPAQLYHTIDLSKKTLIEPTISLNYVGIEIKNKLPKEDYKVKITVEEEVKGVPNSIENLKAGSPCETSNVAFMEAVGALSKETIESNVPKDIENINTELNKVTPACKDELKKIADETIALTKEQIRFQFDVKKNQNIIITITRANKTGKETKWTVILRTPRKLEYISHFGFTFVPKGERNSKNYYAKQDTGSTFIITKMNENGEDFWKDLSLTANFIVFPFRLKNEEADVKFGWAAGLGISGDARFTIYTGPSLVLFDFMSFNVGLGLYNQHRLKGQYEVGQRINENLNFDQLHETGLRPGIVLSLGLRLSKEQLQEKPETVGGN